MVDTTVSDLARATGTPLQRLLEQFREAGIEKSRSEDAVSDEEKVKLLEHLRRAHGKTSDDNRKITLRRKKVSEIKVGGGPASKTVNVEVRGKRTYVKRSVALKDEAERARVAQDDRERRERELHEFEQKRIAAEEKNRAEDGVRQQERQHTAQDSSAAAVAEAPAASNEAVAETPSAAVAQAPVAAPTQPPVETAAVETVKPEAAKPETNVAPAPKAEKPSAARPATRPAKPPAARDNKAKPRTPSAAKPDYSKLSIDERAAIALARLAQAAGGGKPEQEERSAPARNKSPSSGGGGGEMPPPMMDAPGSSGRPAGRNSRGANKSRGGSDNDDRRGGNNARGGRKKPQGAAAAGRGGKGRRGAPQQPSRHQFSMPTTPVVHEVTIPETITVAELANRMAIKGAQVVKALFGMGVMATINQTIDQDTAVLVCEELGHTPVVQSAADVERELTERLLSDTDLAEQSRPPVVTVMGHVDHGKTSLLDYIRRSRVAAGEAGGITQHIGAYHVETQRGVITFLDTPGHAAFSAMRARGAQATDIIVLVVAADDGVMPQTIEGIQHAKAAGVPIVVAVNKIDREAADPERVRSELSQHEVISEEWGGDTQFVHVSAHTGEGIDKILDALSLQAELLELTAPAEGNAKGLVIEASLDRGRGSVATVLVQSGTLSRGQLVVCGKESGRVRAMFDEAGRPVQSAGPSIPVQILGLSGVPDAGDEMLVATDDRAAKELVDFRSQRERDSRLADRKMTTLEDVFSQIKTGEKQTLNLFVKADVQGSYEALRNSLERLSTDEIDIRVIAGGVGGINESDANLVAASGAIMIGFNVRADAAARRVIQEQGIDLHYHSVIYEVIDLVKAAAGGLLAPEIQERIIGMAEVKDVFNSPKFGAVAGSMVVDGVVRRSAPIRVLRDNVVIYTGELESLRRFKDDVNEVRMGTECGIAVRNYNDVHPGDQIEVFERKEVARTL